MGWLTLAGSWDSLPPRGKASSSNTVPSSDGSVSQQAYSVYSDNGGQDWQMGTPVGQGMDENKVVELSNGDIMLNSRPSDNSGYRKVAISTDGGEAYSDPFVETQLPDAEKNGAIARMYPDAPEGSPEAAILLFTNADSQMARVRGTIGYSCDDGTTWSAGRVFQANATSYSTVTALGNDL
jgi:sialidase-1